MPATAFLLAAGLGTRLRPLTLHTPKPLLPVRGIPMLDHALRHVREHGHREVVVNAYWLSDQIVAWAKDKPGVSLSVESPAVLGTGGGLRQARHLLAERFVVVNGDILSDVDLTALWNQPATAVMALRRQTQPTHTGVAIEFDSPTAGVVRGISGVVGEGNPEFHFTGIHVLNRNALDLVPAEAEACIIRTAYRSLIQRGEVRGLLHAGEWTDIGTLAEYESVRG
jgi:NDP-sugar pyrophosphorylase family protein